MSTLATRHAGDTDTLERLARFDTHGQPVLSVYINLDPSRFPTPGTRVAQLGSLLDAARRQTATEEADRVEEWLSSEPAIARGARGLAIFSSRHLLEAVRLTEPVEPLAIVDTIPWLEPLAETISPGNWGVAIVSRRSARLLRGGAGGLTEFATITDQLHRRHAQGGWSQARFQRGIDEQVAAHVRGVAGRLLRAHRRSRFDHVLFACASELRAMIAHSLDSELKGVLVGIIDRDLEHASVEHISGIVARFVERAERERERELVARIEEGLGTGGPAAAGLDEVLSTLEQRRVAVLLVPESASLRAGLCPTRGRLPTDGGRTCPLDGSPLAPVDVIAQVIQEAGRQAAQVVAVRGHYEWLCDHGGIAALLRW
ncbi:MAG TPA: Vms1/Ankzf1 family peptidyl-tRNA hydrolase [Solirubrobacteraceae bacterium]|nr:Vms1/Ankzf1 family peptidyl-tRNA hydrolase [Solirubrobacteraceae bacterium]